MFVGHATFAFAVAVAASRRTGLDRRSTVAVAVVAGLFATVPDVDMVYALVGLAAGGGPMALADSFWGASTVTHRAVTHSLVVAVPAAAGAVCWSHARERRGPTRLAGAALLAVVVAVPAWLDGALAGGVAALFAAAVVAVAALAARFELSARATAGAALLGLWTHPFGDLFTGSPPVVLYPFDGLAPGSRLAPLPDPTLNLLLAFLVELGALWLGLAALASLRAYRLRDAVHRRGVAGAVVGVGLLAAPPPTMAVSYHFVFTVLGGGVASGLAVPADRADLAIGDVLTLVSTGLAAVTAGVLAYGAGYLLLAL
ncbi:MAG: metal-dependent hydrolase [Halobacteriaceae archaeon]